MAEEQKKDAKKPVILPTFRKDLRVFPGPAEPDGTPTYAIQDPLRGQYFKITWAHALVMRVQKPGMKIEELTAEVNKRSPLRISEEEVMEIFADAANLNLLELPKPSEQIQQAAEKTKITWWWWLLMNYLYLRFPILNPDRFLTNTLKYVKPLFTKPFLILYAILAGTGLAVVFLNFERYLHTFTYFFNFEGLIAYFGAIVIVHLLHEFGHAYTAKYFNVYVPTMGVGLMVLVPFMYTNVTDAWKLKARHERFAITIAGVSVELVLAGLATLGWALTDPGMLHSVFFVVSSTSWIASLLMNINPAMRFDGYYLLTDIIGIDNLQQRAFALTRWRLRKFFLGLDVPPPEPDIPEDKLKLMMVYSVYTWIYRIVLYTAIAWFVYVEFTKVLGIILFAVEVVVFITAPFASEIKQLYLHRDYMTWNPRSIITTICCAIFAIWFVFPYPHELSFEAITVPKEEQIVYAPQNSFVSEIYVKRGDRVKKGDVLIRLKSDLLEKNIEIKKTEIAFLEQLLEILELPDYDLDRTYLAPKQAELSHKKAELETLMQRHQKLDIEAEVDGIVFEWDDALRPGLYLSQRFMLGKIAEKGNVKVVCFVPEAQIQGLEEGQKATFRLPSPVENLPGVISLIYKAPNPYLRFPQLASIYKGGLPVVAKREPREGQPAFEFTSRFYEVEVVLDPTDYSLRMGQTGTVVVRGPWESILWNLIKRAQRVVWRESGF